MKKTEKIKLKIEGMHCNSCSMLIDGDLEDQDGVEFANTNFHKQVCEIEFDAEKIDLKEILETIQNTGYNAKVLKD